MNFAVSVTCELPSVILLIGLVLFGVGCYLCLTAQSKIGRAESERDTMAEKLHDLRVDYDLLRAATPFHYTSRKEG